MLLFGNWNAISAMSRGDFEARASEGNFIWGLRGTNSHENVEGVKILVTMTYLLSISCQELANGLSPPISPDHEILTPDLILSVSCVCSSQSLRKVQTAHSKVLLEA